MKAVFENYLESQQEDPAGIRLLCSSYDTIRLVLPIRLPDNSTLKMEDKQYFLERTSLKERMERLLELMQSEIEIAEIEKKIRDRVKKQMEKSQKEYYLNEQMRAIQKEMGEKDDFKNEIAELEEQLAKKKLPAEAEAKVRKEIRKLKMMSPMSAEATVVRNYIDWFLVLPWATVSEMALDIDEAQRILDEDHYGLKEVKERIIEYLAVQKLVGKTKGPILCLVGPPGVGKTSLAKSVARATGQGVRPHLSGRRAG